MNNVRFTRVVFRGLKFFPNRTKYVGDKEFCSRLKKKKQKAVFNQTIQLFID